MSAVPELKDELDRKAYETIEWLTQSLDNGSLTEAQFSTGIDVLFMAVNGLVAERVNELVTAAGSLAGAASSTVKRHFVEADKVTTLAREPGSRTVIVSVLRSGAALTQRSHLSASPAQAKAAMARLAAKLIDAGQVEL